MDDDGILWEQNVLGRMATMISPGIFHLYVAVSLIGDFVFLFVVFFLADTVLRIQLQ